MYWLWPCPALHCTFCMFTCTPFFRCPCAMQGAICHHCCTQEGVEHIMSTTVPPNTPAVRIFSRLGFTHCRTVDRWPQEHLQEAYEAAVGFRPNQEQPEQLMHFDATQLNMLDHIPGMRRERGREGESLHECECECVCVLCVHVCVCAAGLCMLLHVVVQYHQRLVHSASGHLVAHYHASVL